MTPEEIPGWFDYALLYEREVRRIAPGGTVVEIGCWLGRSLAFLAREVKISAKPIHVFGVDPGFGSVGMADEPLHRPVLAECGGNTTSRLLVNLRDCGLLDDVTVIASPSVSAARLFADESVDFCFIDGDHSEAVVKADLATWWPKIKRGGVLAGHDFDKHWPSVVAAVTQFFGRQDLADPDCPHCWSQVKP